MIIKYIPAHQIDKPSWDKCIRSAVNGNIYAYSWYLDLMCDSWDALVADDYNAVFPLTFKQKAGITYLYQPFFTQQLGIFSINHLTPESVEQFLQAIPAKFRFAEINLNTFNKADEVRWKIKKSINHELDLIETYEQIKRGYSENTRRNIARAAKNGITISTNVKPEEIITLFRNNKGRNISQLGEYDYRRLLRLIYQCLHDHKAICYGAYTSNNTFCAGAVFVFSHRKAVFLFSAVSEEARTSGAMSFLIDRFIQDSSGNHLTLDFEGSNDANLARFYRSFGAKVITYPSLRFNRLPLHLSMLMKIVKMLRKISMKK